MFSSSSEKHHREFLLPWLSSTASSNAETAQHIFRDSAEAIPEVAALKRTPQGAPWHCEGPFVADHIVRILTAVEHVLAGAELSEIEEFAREKDLILDINALTATIRKYARFLRAYALAHDLAKADTLRFDAQEGSEGEREGFAAHSRRIEATATEAEVHRYDKLWRAFLAHEPEGKAISASVADFYVKTGIGVHYSRHATVGASAAYAPARDAILRQCVVPLSYARLLTELVRLHLDLLGAFGCGEDENMIRVFVARARQTGLSSEVFADLLPAILFLDAVAGSILSKDGKLMAQTEMLINYLRAERLAFPDRQAARERAATQAKKQAREAVLAACGLSAEEVFDLLQTPIGPIRGTVMRAITAALDDPTAKLDFGAHTEEIRRRIALARTRLVE